jgi:hypothetical protein
MAEGLLPDLPPDPETPASTSSGFETVLPLEVLAPTENPLPSGTDIPEAATAGLLACGLAILACGRLRARPA